MSRYSWKKHTMPLTKDMKKRGVIFASSLEVTNRNDIEYKVHEVFDTDEDKEQVIANLKDVSFFKSMAHDFGYQVIERVWQ